MENTSQMKTKLNKICVIGCGYVGLPLALELSKSNKNVVIGLDISSDRINELQKNYDSTREVSTEDLESVNITFTDDYNAVSMCNIYIVTVPTPIDENFLPNYKYILSATKAIANILTKNDLIIYESTVDPGTTREKCIPIIENISGLKLNDEFGVGYSPERAVPGDRSKRVDKIIKVISASDNNYMHLMRSVYSSIEGLPLYEAESIEIAEATKLLENIQRDVNISLMNEIDNYFNKLNIPTKKVINAASTKWNFGLYYPGLVGGHCISVDPYYYLNNLSDEDQKASVVFQARKINENYSTVISNRIEDFLMNETDHIILYGVTFKQNCVDIRNTKIVDVYKILKSKGYKILLHDPIADKKLLKNEYSIDSLTEKEILEVNDKISHAIILVQHDGYTDFLKKLNSNIKILDIWHE
jgi:UDP-N-acetyl-D-glucosamine/UDP-N-acetyl-D-galactosamine dehydrogenase